MEKQIVKVGEFGEEYDLVFFGEKVANAWFEQKSVNITIYAVKNERQYLLVSSDEWYTLVRMIETDELIENLPGLARQIGLDLTINLDKALEDFPLQK